MSTLSNRLVMLLIVLLVATLSFSLGYIIAMERERPSIIIESMD